MIKADADLSEHPISGLFGALLILRDTKVLSEEDLRLSRQKIITEMETRSPKDLTAFILGVVEIIDL